MKKIVSVVLTLSIMLCASGCSNRINDLIEQEKYEEALTLMEKNPEKFADMYDEVRYEVAKTSFENHDFNKAINLLTDNNYDQANALLNDVNNLKAAIEIEDAYTQMLHEIEEYNPEKWNPDFDYLEGFDFYLKICDTLNETKDILVRDNKVDNIKEKFVDIFGFEPTSVAQAKESIEKLYNEMGFEKFYDSPFCYYQALNYVLETLTKNSEHVRFEMTETNGFVIIEKPYEFLHSKEISTKTFAYILGICEGFGGQVERLQNSINITFKNTQTDSYYSRGYFYCAPNKQHKEISEFINAANVSIDSWGLDENGVWMDITLSNDNEYNFKYLSVDTILVAADGRHIETASILLENVSSKKISFTLDFHGVTMEDLKEKKCSIELFPAIVLND